MNFDFDKLLNLAQHISFTTFLILCVGAMSYAMFHLYTDSRTDWNQVQLNAQNIGQMNQNVNQLVGKIDQLLDELHVCLRSPTAPSAALGPLSVRSNLWPFRAPLVPPSALANRG